MLLDALQQVLEELAPSRLARMGDEPWWQGVCRTEVQLLGVCVDTTPENLQQAAALGVEAIIAHHGWDGSLPELVTEQQLAIYKCHTNWDRAAGGNSVALAERLGLESVVGFNYSAIGDCQLQPLADMLVRAGRLVGRRCLPYFGDPQRPIRRVGVMAGACFGPGFEDEWAELWRRGAELVLSGDLSQRVARTFCARGMAVADIGHSSSELPGMERLAELLSQRLPIPVLMLPDYYHLDVAVL